MEQKEIMIVPPEDYEIDTENSTFECIKFKKVEKDFITMDDVWDTLDEEDLCTFDNNGISTFEQSIDAKSRNNAKVAAYAALSDIAEYYNQGWKPDWNDGNKFKCFIAYHNEGNTYRTESNVKINRGEIYFKDQADAQSVIDNPNFREILDVLFKN